MCYFPAGKLAFYESVTMKNRNADRWNKESMESKVRWFMSLSMTERMEVFCEFSDLMVAINPDIGDKKRAESTAGSVQVLSAK